MQLGGVLAVFFMLLWFQAKMMRIMRGVRGKKDDRWRNREFDQGSLYLEIPLSNDSLWLHYSWKTS